MREAFLAPYSHLHIQHGQQTWFLIRLLFTASYATLSHALACLSLLQGYAAS